MKHSITRLLAVLIGFSLFMQVGQAQEDEASISLSAKGLRSLSITVDEGNFQLIVLEDFEQAEDWTAHSNNPITPSQARKLAQVGEIRSLRDPDRSSYKGETYSPEPNLNEDLNHILGVKTAFLNPGVDLVEVKPPQEYTIEGNVRQISIWVLGRDYKHTLYVKLRDYKGRLHHLKLGQLNFTGWRKLIVPIPVRIPQTDKHIALKKNLSFVSFFVRSHPKEVTGSFYFYLDGFKILLDNFQLNYPGAEIKDNW